MNLNEILSRETILPDLKVSSKKQLLQELAAKAATISGLPDRQIFETLLQRERLGSTGVGNGIAIPHGKIAYNGRLFGVFAKLAKPIEYESVDDQEVDLVFLLIAPEGAGADHLKALSRVARIFRNPKVVERLRASSSQDEIWELLQDIEVSNAA